MYKSNLVAHATNTRQHATNTRHEFTNFKLTSGSTAVLQEVQRGFGQHEKEKTKFFHHIKIISAEKLLKMFFLQQK